MNARKCFLIFSRSQCDGGGFRQDKDLLMGGFTILFSRKWPYADSNADGARFGARTHFTAIVFLRASQICFTAS